LILVAGGSGFIGRAVVRRLREVGADVAVMTAHPKRSGPVIERLGARVVRGDVQDPLSLAAAVAGADAVVQALTFPTFPVEKPSRGYTFEEFDHQGTKRLAAAAARARVGRFVFVSGVGADPDSPKSRYRAKWHGEEALRATGISHAVIRPSWVYGPEDRALNRFLAFYRWLPFVPVVGTGRQRLQPVLIDDVAKVVARAAEPTGPTGTFEIGGPDVLSMNEILATMMDVMGRRKPLLHFPPFLPRVAGFFVQVIPGVPLSPAAVDFLTEDAVADTGPLLRAFELSPMRFREGLQTYLPARRRSERR
jgi:NADH dehydrogenase